MSSYWKGYYGTGLVLSQTEYDAFIAQYLQSNRLSHTEFDDALEDGLLCEYAFIKSKYSHDTETHMIVQEQDKIFYIAEILTDNCDGMCLTPYRVHGKPNLPLVNGKPSKDYRAKDLRFENCYVIFSDQDVDGPSAFEHPVYASYDEFVQEFKDKLEAYLPPDFDWDEHIGRFSYACYA